MFVAVPLLAIAAVVSATLNAAGRLRLLADARTGLPPSPVEGVVAA